jgi:hypothetical protein
MATNRERLIAAYREERADGSSPRAALSGAQAAIADFTPCAATVAAHRVRTRSKLLTGLRDTWRLAYSVARIEARSLYRRPNGPA